MARLSIFVEVAVLRHSLLGDRELIDLRISFWHRLCVFVDIQGKAAHGCQVLRCAVRLSLGHLRLGVVI